MRVHGWFMDCGGQRNISYDDEKLFREGKMHESLTLPNPLHLPGCLKMLNFVKERKGMWPKLLGVNPLAHCTTHVQALSRTKEVLE